MRYKAVIFDFDGTLLYTVEDLAAAVNFALEKNGFPTHSVEKIQRMIGNGVAMLVARALPGGFDTPGYEGILADFRECYSAHKTDTTRPYPGIPELLARLKGEGYALAVVTNKFQSAAEDLTRRFFPGLVDIVIGDAPERARKPSPDGVNEALGRLGAENTAAVYVGDTEVDMQTGINAKTDYICVSWGYRTHEELTALGAQKIADTTQELYDML